MKNIHILPTDKPSRLFDDGIELYLGEIKDRKGHPVTSYNIYITSDEEIKEGDWFYLDMSHSNTLPDEIHQMGNDKWSKTGGIHFCEGNTWVDSCKKIILTTDPDLIKDGVQAIDNDFLEWFVKNPSCEEVEVEKEQYYQFVENTKLPFKPNYKIIIPKEKPKANLERLPFPELIKEFAEYYKNILLIEETKQETIEEAAEWITKKFNGKGIEVKIFDWVKNKTYNYPPSKLLEEYAKWQAERMYSEEEVLDILHKYDLEEPFDNKKWFEQLKKK